MQITITKSEAERVITALEYAYSDKIFPFDELKDIRQQLIEEVSSCK